ncbi:Protein of unknown function [Sphingomonas guangdongensis]|uniref:DUF3616 domain-containing protein n=1 Tax=Sphingomonas guangdongensis TaxID=1141890 RepID=A0A285R6Y6_9SPHN|nr:DUF3616 domain-containing protein [Sphingomonas guangdongensis]SOB88142.1 Protein of unknown function [Sphingomonas guangdongensis]
MTVRHDRAGWPALTQPSGHLLLQLAPAADGEDDPILDLSAAVRIGSTLFLGSDEGVAVERLSWNGERWVSAGRTSLIECLDVASGEEADIEGLAEDDGWLWVLGSHARTRPKLKKRDDERLDLTVYADLKDTRARCLLARLPLAADSVEPRLLAPVANAGDRRAQVLKRTKHGNLLSRALAKDPLIGPSTRIPAKEGGVDLEGIAVCFPRVALGMRGPVIQTYAVLLEFEVNQKGGDLKIDGPVYKRLLDLEGLGIRDLKRVGDDLLILAGPTTALDGPCAVYRWRDWAGNPPEHKHAVRLHRPERIVELPFGRGDDHPEALAVVEQDGARQLLVICDSPAAWRVDSDRRSISCDVFDLNVLR